MTDDQLIQVLQNCTVRLSVGGSIGTGFFVAPNLILTCAHVVKGAVSKPINAFWQSQARTYVAEISQCLDDSNLDLALLRLLPDQEGVPIANQPWVDLDKSAPILDEALYSYGYPQSYPNGDSATFAYEGDSTGKSGSKLYKLKEGQVDFGLSGAPLLNQRTGKVCGIVNLSRHVTSDLGGRAVPSTVILNLFPALLDQAPFNSRTPLTNPFRPLAGQVDNPQLFFDRSQVIRRIFETLNSGSSVALIGEREMGKSSILWALCQQAQARLQLPRQPIYLNLQLIYSEDEFYSELCEKAGIPDLRGRELLRALRDQRLLLLLDEVERIQEESFTRQVREQLRGLAEGSNAPLRLVLAASISLDRLFPDSYQEGNVSPLVGICLEEPLRAWDETTIRTFITSRLEPTPIRFTDAEIDQLIQGSQGKPKHLMRLCHQTFASYQE